MAQDSVFVLDVRPLYSGEVKSLDFSFDIPARDFAFDDLTVDGEVKASGSVSRRAQGRSGSESYFELKLTVSAQIETACARCLAPLHKTLEFTQTAGVTPTHVSDDCDDAVMTVDGMLDVGEMARTLFVLNMPMRFLCREDCRGLCPTCGKNRNEGNCSCESKETDPRLAVLKNLKFD